MNTQLAGLPFKNRDTGRCLETTDKANLFRLEYSKSLLGNEDEFIGSIILGDGAFLNYHLKFNKNHMADLEDIVDLGTNRNTYGLIYIDNIFQEVTIIRFKQEQNGVYCSDGWYISAPCTTREEAVQISNRLLQKDLGDKYSVK